MLLQQLFHMRREAAATPAINVGLVEVELEGVFYDWRSMPEIKAKLQKLKEDEFIAGGFGHLGGCQQKIVVEQVRWFRTTVESRKPEARETEANQAAEPTRTTVTPPAGAGDRASGARGSP